MKLSEGSIGTLSNILSHCIQKNLPFFSYRMPYSKEIVSGVQTTQQLRPFTGFDNLKTGFLIAPFESESAAIPLFIVSDISFQNANIQQDEFDLIRRSSFEPQQQETTPIEISKENYLLQAEKLIEALHTNSLQKVVLSRVVNRDFSNKNQAPELFEKLTQIYPHAFVSIFHLPGQGVWVGATPETLLLTHKDGIETMSLAATKAIGSIQDWSPKEREEQQMVSDFVENVLRDFSFEEIVVEGPVEQQAGNVCHLMTKYNCKGNLSDNSQLELVNQLHPTPAVCGIPKEEALRLIRETEVHDREYYAGYLGPISAEKKQLFVNLRCMKLTSQGVSFFVGGGLTAQSKAEEEWQETCLKLETLRSIL
jgi:isochorismate synthase